MWWLDVSSLQLDVSSLRLDTSSLLLSEVFPFFFPPFSLYNKRTCAFSNCSPIFHFLRPKEKVPLYLFPRHCKVATLNILKPRNPICANTDVSVNEYKSGLQSAFSLDMLWVFLRQHTSAASRRRRHISRFPCWTNSKDSLKIKTKL